MRKRSTKKAAVMPTTLPTALNAPMTPLTIARIAVPMVVSALTITSRTRAQERSLTPTSCPRASTTARTFSTTSSPDGDGDLLDRRALAAELDHGVACRIERTCQQRHRGDDEADGAAQQCQRPRNNPAARPSSVVDATACVTRYWRRSLAAEPSPRQRPARWWRGLARAPAPRRHRPRVPVPAPRLEGAQVGQSRCCFGTRSGDAGGEGTCHPAKGGDQHDARQMDQQLQMLGDELDGLRQSCRQAGTGIALAECALEGVFQASERPATVSGRLAYSSARRSR